MEEGRHKPLAKKRVPRYRENHIAVGGKALEDLDDLAGGCVGPHALVGVRGDRHPRGREDSTRDAARRGRDHEVRRDQTFEHPGRWRLGCPRSTMEMRPT
jgi:hypothetical protein